MISRMKAKVAGVLAASIPILGLVSSYTLCYVKHGALFAHDGWVYVPAGLSCLPTSFLLWPLFTPFHKQLQDLSLTTVGYHALPPLWSILCAAVNFCIVYYTILFIGKWIRQSPPREMCD